MENININNNDYFLDNLNYKNLKDLIEFNNQAYSSLENKDLFILPTTKDYNDYLKFNSEVLVLYKKNRIVAYSALTFHQEEYDDWINDFDLSLSDLEKTAKFDSILVLKEYRYKGIFNYFLKKSILFLKENKYRFLVCHTHPDNKESLDTFLKFGFRKICKKQFCGKERLFLLKDLYDDWIN